jgi:hypothetical protein
MPIGHVAIDNIQYGDPSAGLTWQLRLGGGGSDAYLYNVWGSIAGAPQPYAISAENGVNFVRNSRTGLFIPGEFYRQSANGSIVAAPPNAPPASQSFDNMLGAWGLRQNGSSCLISPISIAFRAPHLVPQGLINVAIWSWTLATYGGANAVDPQQCINTVVHMMFDWETEPPPTVNPNPSGPGTVIVQTAPGITTPNMRVQVRQNPS